MERGREGWVLPIHQLKIMFKNMLPLYLYSPTKGVIKKRVSRVRVLYLYSPIKITLQKHATM